LTKSTEIFRFFGRVFGPTTLKASYAFKVGRCLSNCAPILGMNGGQTRGGLPTLQELRKL